MIALVAEFMLDKWYLDLAGEFGAVIVYVASLRWGLLHLRYASLMEHDGRSTTWRSSLQSVSPPEHSDDSIHWQHAPLRLDLTGQFIHTSPSIDLLQTREGSVRWHCIAPLASMSVRIAGRPLRGLGYIERLTMTLPPWQLPIDTLRWGRFTSPTHSLAWISWEGSHPLKLLLTNGQPANADAITDDRIVTPQHSLDLPRATTLREGPIAGTILSSITPLRSILPSRILSMTESKWFGQTQLDSIPGQTIHECVRFGDPLQ